MPLLQSITRVADLVRRQADSSPDQVATWFENRETTFGQLNERSSQVANGLITSGAELQDRIAYLGKNMDLYYEILFGAAKARMVLAGINTRLAPPEIQFILSDSESTILFVTADFYDVIEKIKDQCPNLRQVIAVEGGHSDWEDYSEWRNSQSTSDPNLNAEDDDDIIQLYTSGTTGLPKGVCHTNKSFEGFFTLAIPFEWTNYPAGASVMNIMPFFHVAGVNTGLIALGNGARIVIIRDIDPALILKLIPEQKIEYALWVPAVILMLTQVPGVEDVDFSSLKHIIYGASPIAEDLVVAAIKLMGARFTQVYGLTETSGAGTFLVPEDHEPSLGKLRSCGKPWTGSEVRCVDENGNPVPTGEVGEITIKGPFLMKGYWKRTEATKEAIRDEHFFTGDAGYFDEDGYLYIYDRVKDMIVSGGENVYPAEVENAVFSHPDVADVAVIGIPSEKWGEDVKAIIVCKPDKKPTEEEIIAWTRERIAGFKCPKSVDYIDVLPRNPTGKILRRVLREPYWEGKERRVN